MRNFKELKVCQKGFAIAINSFKIVETFPKEENMLWPIRLPGQRYLFHPILQKGAAGQAIRTTIGLLKYRWVHVLKWKHNC
jgi:hypothetical protein